jgi:tetratricopeptide (TPR) repeat protein
MTSAGTSRAEQLRLQALGLVRADKLEEALDLFDQALGLATDEEARELITVNKADTLIGLEQSGPEVQALPQIVMRRRNLRHVYLAAYALQYKFRREGNLERATFYGQLALRTADEANEPSWKRVVLVELGNVYEMDSRIPEAIDCFQAALAIEEESKDNRDREISFAYALENLGYCKLLQNEFEEGIALIHRALQSIADPHATAEAFLDLCYGYLGLEQLDRAREFGARALEIAREVRQIRNLHYLLGEIAYKQGDTELAGAHFEELGKFYPGFRHLKDVLFAIDLRAMVNLKL